MKTARASISRESIINKRNNQKGKTARKLRARSFEDFGPYEIRSYQTARSVPAGESGRRITAQRQTGQTGRKLRARSFKDFERYEIRNYQTARSVPAGESGAYK
jgi:hypothetical protein